MATIGNKYATAHTPHNADPPLSVGPRRAYYALTHMARKTADKALARRYYAAVRLKRQDPRIDGITLLASVLWPKDSRLQGGGLQP